MPVGLSHALTWSQHSPPNYLQAEIEHFVNPDDKSHPRFKEVADLAPLLYSRWEGRAGELLLYWVHSLVGGLTPTLPRCSSPGVVM